MNGKWLSFRMSLAIAIAMVALLVALIAFGPRNSDSQVIQPDGYGYGYGYNTEVK